jgi:hypothetical protein
MFAALLPYMRPILIATAVVNASAAAIWIGSIYVELPQRYAMLWVAIALGNPLLGIILMVDWFGYLGLVILIRMSPMVSQRLGEILRNTFAYYPGIFLIVRC